MDLFIYTKHLIRAIELSVICEIAKLKIKKNKIKIWTRFNKYKKNRFIYTHTRTHNNNNTHTKKSQFILQIIFLVNIKIDLKQTGRYTQFEH